MNLLLEHMATNVLRIYDALSIGDVHAQSNGVIVFDEDCSLSTWSFEESAPPVRRCRFPPPRPIAPEFKVTPSGSFWLCEYEGDSAWFSPRFELGERCNLDLNGAVFIDDTTYVRGLENGANVFRVDYQACTATRIHHSDEDTWNFKVVNGQLWTYGTNPHELKCFSTDLSQVQRYPLRHCEVEGVRWWCVCGAQIAVSHVGIAGKDHRSLVSIFDTQSRHWIKTLMVPAGDYIKRLYHGLDGEELYVCSQSSFTIVDVATGEVRFSADPGFLARYGEPDVTYFSETYGFRCGDYVFVMSSAFPVLAIYDAATNALVQELELPFPASTYARNRFCFSPRQPVFLNETDVVFVLVANESAFQVSYVFGLAHLSLSGPGVPVIEVMPRIPMRVERLVEDDGTSAYRIHVDHDDANQTLRQSELQIVELALYAGRNFAKETPPNDLDFNGKIELVLDKGKTAKESVPALKNMIASVQSLLEGVSASKKQKGKKQGVKVTLLIQ